MCGKLHKLFQFCGETKGDFYIHNDDPIITSDNTQKGFHKLIMIIVHKIEKLLCVLRLCVSIGWKP